MNSLSLCLLSYINRSRRHFKLAMMMISTSFMLIILLFFCSFNLIILAIWLIHSLYGWIIHVLFMKKVGICKYMWVRYHWHARRHHHIIWIHAHHMIWMVHSDPKGIMSILLIECMHLMHLIIAQRSIKVIQ